jgi:trk system potassium uptake protein
MKSVALLNALGIILTALGIIILAPVLVALLVDEYTAILPFVIASALALALGLLLQWRGGFNRDFDTLKRSEGLLIVALAWVVSGMAGAVPYLFFGLGPLDACFESISGFTTTGATVLTDFSHYPKTFFFWRSLTQWLGGMGIIVLFIAILPQFAVAGRQMFFAEATGPTEEKITPRVTQMAKALWTLYILLTGCQILLLSLVGMPLFDAVCNSFSTLAAGGFSPHPQSIGGYGNSAITWIVTLFMFLAGGNFALQYRALFQGAFASLARNEEFRLYTGLVISMSGLLFLALLLAGTAGTADGIRDSLFQIISLMTSTGFASTDFALWLIPAQTLLFAVMLVGGCAGSAGGGPKVVRVLFGIKYLKREVSRIVHPRAVLPIKIDGTTVAEDIQRQIIGFLFFYIALVTLSSMVVTIIEGDMGIGLVGTIATIGNTGPGFGAIGPMESYGPLSPLTKLIFIINMVVGRLELIPFIAMLHPDFWGSKG